MEQALDWALASLVEESSTFSEAVETHSPSYRFWKTDGCQKL